MPIPQITTLVRLVLVALSVTWFEGSAFASALYVAPTGTDQNPGSRSRPLATLKRAIEVSRENGKNRRIVLRGGDYYEVAVVLTSQDNGLRIEAEPGEEPVLFGGRIISGFVPDGGALLAADLPTNGVAKPDFRMLWVNGRMAARARFPESGRLGHESKFEVPWMGTYGGGWKRKPTHEELTTLRLKPGTFGPDFQAINAEVTVFHEWDESLVGVSSWDPANAILRFSQEAGHPPGAFGQQTCIIWNTREGLTSPGQWMLDRGRNKVVYWPLPGETAASLRVFYPATDVIIRVEGTSQEPVRSVTIKGLTLTVANTPLKTGGFGAFAFDGAVNVQHACDCRFSEMLVQQVAGQGFKLSDAVTCEVSKTEIRETGAGGIICEDARSLRIAQAAIHHIGRLYPSAIGLACSGTSNRVNGNFIHDTPYVGLTCDGYGAQIENNRFERVMQELHDGAAVYLGGTNHLVRGNHCREIGPTLNDRRYAYYLDELVRNTRVEGNLAVGCPFPLHNHIASDNRIAGNVFIYDGDLRMAFFRCERHEFDRNLIVASGSIEVFRPEAVNCWTNNLFFSRKGEVNGHAVEQYTAGPAKPLRVPGVELGPDPEVKEREAGLIWWPKKSAAARLGIPRMDVRQAGRDAGRPTR